MMVPAYNGIGL